MTVLLCRPIKLIYWDLIGSIFNKQIKISNPFNHNKTVNYVKNILYDWPEFQLSHYPGVDISNQSGKIYNRELQAGPARYHSSPLIYIGRIWPLCLFVISVSKTRSNCDLICGCQCLILVVCLLFNLANHQRLIWLWLVKLSFKEEVVKTHCSYLSICWLSPGFWQVFPYFYCLNCIPRDWAEGREM